MNSRLAGSTPHIHGHFYCPFQAHALVGCSLPAWLHVCSASCPARGARAAGVPRSHPLGRSSWEKLLVKQHRLTPSLARLLVPGVRSRAVSAPHLGHQEAEGHKSRLGEKAAHSSAGFGSCAMRRCQRVHPCRKTSAPYGFLSKAEDLGRSGRCLWIQMLRGMWCTQQEHECLFTPPM